MSEEINYQLDLAIDPYQLEEEWLTQPGLYMKYAALASEAQRENDLSKEAAEVVRAVIDNEIRRDPVKYFCPKDKSGEPKPTESWISNTIILQASYKEAIQQSIETKHRASVLAAAVRAFDHRKKALEMEVQLWLGGYFSVPNEKKLIAGAKRVLSDVVCDKQRQVLSQRRKREDK